jgi:hypothetical protein
MAVLCSVGHVVVVLRVQTDPQLGAESNYRANCFCGYGQSMNAERSTAVKAGPGLGAFSRRSSSVSISHSRCAGPARGNRCQISEQSEDRKAVVGISVFAISTFDTDYLLVKAADLQRNIDTLRQAGHSVN